MKLRSSIAAATLATAALAVPAALAVSPATTALAAQRHGPDSIIGDTQPAFLTAVTVTTISGSCWSATVTGTHVVYGGSVTVKMTKFTLACSGTWSAEDACYEPGVGTNWNLGAARTDPGTETIRCGADKENAHGGVRVGGSYHGVW